MSAKGAFENQFEEYSPQWGSNVLDSSRGVSEIFSNKLKSFKETKLNLLITKMKKDIFCDGTVYSGSAGLALYYFLCGTKSDSEQHFKTALNYINLNNLKARNYTFLCGDAGPLAIATVISYKLNDDRPENLPNYEILAQRLTSLDSLNSQKSEELLYGKVGYLYALLFVNKHIKDKEVIPGVLIKKVIDLVIENGKQFASKTKSDSPLLWQWHEKVYFGAAHGIAGILYILLQARHYIAASEIRTSIKETLDWLLNQRYKSGNFPSSMRSSNGDKLVQWCHGAPGFVPLCILASQIYNEEKYMNIALKCGDVIWERGLTTKGYSMCHGVSGNAYAFLQLYQITKKSLHLYRACCFMEWCAVERTGTEMHQPDRPASLFEGIVGRIYLAEDIINPMEAKFPAFTL